MLCSRTISRAALVLAAALLWASPAAADNTIGNSCPPGGAGSARSADGNNEWCNGTTWQFPAYQFGSTAASCDSDNAGRVQWTGSAFQGCNGTSWGSLASSGSINLGSLTTANPQISGDVDTGFYTADAGLVNVGIGGVKVAEWSSSGEVVTGTSTANAFIPTSSSAPITGMYLRGTNALGFSTSGSEALTISTTGYVGIGTTTPANKLDVNGGVAIGSYVSSAGFSNGLVVSGAVGLGTNAAQTSYQLTTAGGTYSTQTSSSHAGVAGLNTAVGGAGYGGYFNAATTAAGYGVYSVMSGTANTGHAGYFTNTGANAVNYGLYASTSSATGYAGYFQGTVRIVGNNSSGAAPLALNVTGGTSSSSTGGYISLTGGAGATGGIVTLTGGLGTGGCCGDGGGGTLQMLGGTNAGSGGAVNITGGTASNGFNGGTIALNGGVGSGAHGNVSIAGSRGNLLVGSASVQTGYVATIANGLYVTQTVAGYGGIASINSAVSGAGYGGYFSSATTAAGFGVYSLKSGTANTGYAGYFTNTGTNAINYGLYASTSSATGYAGYFAGAVSIAGALATKSSSTSLTADDQLVDVTGKSFARLASDDATATNRTFCLTAGVDGQRLVIELTSNAAELTDGAQPCAGSPATTNLPGTATFGVEDTLEVIYDGSKWIGVSASDN